MGEVRRSHATPEQRAAWRLRDPEKARAQCRASAKRQREAHPEEVAEYARAYRASHRERFITYSREWRAKNPDRAREHAMRAWYKRRAQLKAVEYEDLDRWEIYERDGGECRLCGGSVPPPEFDLDHIIPISRGGPHTRANVATSHRGCNRSKGSKCGAWAKS